MALENLKEHPLYQPVLLGAVALLASVTLAWVADATREAIGEAEAADLRDSLVEVLPDGFADNNLLADRVEIDAGGEDPLLVYRARQGGTVKGVVFKVVGKGYGGEIVILMAVDKDGGILGVRVLKHTETPGLGDKIEIAKSGWINGFTGKALDGAVWAVKKDGGGFDQLAGATITPRAVVNAVKSGLETFARHKAALLEGERSS
ncbi:MAG: RnfABCDGE type electron transport complex subunit G [Candidatus Accumulibacter sp.]|jgi:electron transport complex protein RnfG|nr:RnfABCDGE type electron transport complex subunit G [Accumulibacter sp.]